MTRALSPAAVREAQKEHAADPFLVLLTITTAAETVRLVANTEDIPSRGATFVAIPFRIALPDTEERTITEASLEVDNVDPRLWQAIRQIEEPAPVLLEVILASDPDTVVLTAEGLVLREAVADLTTITARLVPDTIWQRGWPADDFDPAQNPGLFT